MKYSLEGGIQVRRGRVARDQVIQLIPPNADVGRNLLGVGAVYERGVQQAQEALDSGRKVEVRYVYRDPMEAWAAAKIRAANEGALLLVAQVEVGVGLQEQVLVGPAEVHYLHHLRPLGLSADSSGLPALACSASCCSRRSLLPA